MRPGDVVDHRFELEWRAGAGGMGEVYRAFDRHAGSEVALKILHAGTPLEAVRFSREAEVLSAVSHPRIVRYLGHGRTETGAHYMAMEWLEGETLADRLERTGLTVAETIALGRCVADALGVAHKSGVVHRDLKPSNLFLRDGAIEGVTLIDFGIARVLRPGATLTSPGSLVGTPGYIAPEQARGGSLVGPRADVFSLGCVLYKCLIGRPPFKGDDALAVLLKVVLEEPARLHDLRPEVPVGLSNLVARMLSKAPDTRPPDGAAVAMALAELDSDPEPTPVPTPPSALRVPSSVPPPELTNRERRLLCLVVARWGGADTEVEVTLSDADSHARDAALHAVAERHDGSIELLADGSFLVVLKSAETATDLAARAARCALSLASLLDRTTIAVVSGRAFLTARLPVGELIDRAVALLAEPPAGRARASIRVDEATVGLLGARFEIRDGASGGYLLSEHRAFEASRTLLGKPTPCVGREPELALIESIVAQSIDEEVATAVLVTGAAGVGKSRLRSELIRRLGERTGSLEIWAGRGDPLTSGSAFGLLGQALRAAVGIAEGERVDVGQRRLRARVGRHIKSDPAIVERIAAFLGEIVGIPFPDTDNVELRAARRDPLLMGDQMRRAFEEFLAAETVDKTVVLVLEDLHWSDRPTVKFIGAALRSLPYRPWIVLAFARPDVHAVFPELWAGRSVRTVQLAALGRKAAERLCRLVLGGDTPDATVQAIVERADGNAFYLEELIRAAEKADGGALPESVLAMVQARLEAFDAEARRVLRAASIFGKIFWAGGVSALMGGADMTPWLAYLAEREVISMRSEESTSFPGETEYSFRHGLVLEAAYGMLTERDRQVGHFLAGEWLERAGEREAGRLGEHFERGGEPRRALTFYRRAAEQALEGDDLSEVLRWTSRALAGMPLDATEDADAQEELGIVHKIQAEAHRLRGELSLGEEHARAAEGLLRKGSDAWFRAKSQLMILMSRLGQNRELIAIGQELSELWSTEASSAQIIATVRAAEFLIYCGEYARADELLARSEGAARETSDPQTRGWVLLTMATRALVDGDIERHQDLAGAAAKQFVSAGDRRTAVKTWIPVGYGDGQLGRLVEAELKLREAMAVAERMSMPTVVAYAQHHLGRVLAQRGELDEARAIEAVAATRCAECGHARLAGASRSHLALILAMTGELPLAEIEATLAIKILRDVPPTQAYAFSARARVRLANGQAREGLDDAALGAEMLRTLGGIDDGEAHVRLVHAEALRAVGDVAAANAAIDEARARLLARANRMRNVRLRQSFLERAPDNVRTLALAGEWLEGLSVGAYSLGVK